MSGEGRMTRDGTVESTLHGLVTSYLAGEITLGELGGGYLTVFLAHDPDGFRDPDTWLLFNLISEQLSFVMEESTSHGHHRGFEENFRHWLIDAVHVLEWPDRAAKYRRP